MLNGYRRSISFFPKVSENNEKSQGLLPYFILAQGFWHCKLKLNVFVASGGCAWQQMPEMEKRIYPQQRKDDDMHTLEKSKLRPYKRSKFRVALSQWQLYALLLPGVLVMFVFHYLPMYGATIAFKDLNIGDDMFGGTWVGFKHFERFFTSPYFGMVLTNTLRLTLTEMLLTTPLPIIFALMVHNSSNKYVRKLTQTFSYMPHLLATVIVVTIIELFCRQESGLINVLLDRFGVSRVDFLGREDMFVPVYIISNVWAGLGSNAVIYIAALSAVDVQLTEAATIDGANKLQRMWHVDIPTIMPTFVMLTIMNFGKILNVGYEKVLLMQNDLNIGVSEIITTYVYKQGIISSQFGYSAAVSLFNNVVGLMLVLIVNKIAKKTADMSLF
jgi:putative aldouronate transport system permease protein